MSLQKEINYKGFTTPACYKITWISITEQEKIDWVKTYKALLLINSYTDLTKEYDIEQVNVPLTWLYEVELNLPTYYSKLKELEVYKDSLDI